MHSLKGEIVTHELTEFFYLLLYACICVCVCAYVYIYMQACLWVYGFSSACHSTPVE